MISGCREVHSFFFESACSLCASADGDRWSVEMVGDRDRETNPSKKNMLANTVQFRLWYVPRWFGASPWTHSRSWDRDGDVTILC